MEKKISLDMLAMADKVEKFTFTKEFSEEQMQDFRIRFTAESLDVKSLQVELKRKTAEIKDQLKPLKTQLEGTLNKLHYKSEPVTEECRVFFDHDKGKADMYDKDGNYVGSRQLLIEERQQPTVFKVLRDGTHD